MITGYNTDVRHGEVVFHVQTEDKGVSNPYIESLVYVGGQVLASKRASYAEMIAEGKEEKDIVAFMDHQHRTMIAAIRHGKLDGKLAALSASRTTGPVAVATPPTGMQPVVVRHPSGPLAAPPAPAPPAPAVPADVGETVARALSGGETVARPATSATATPETPMEPIAARPARPAAPERTLDQVILEYLTSEADQEQLVLLLEEERNLGLGQRATLVLRATSSKSGRAVADTQVSVRMISTVVEPRVLANGRTDDRGLLALGFDIPELGRGTSALIINAVSAIGRAELKHLL
ncbi:MAG: hypothetical protein ACJ76N_26055 [Thermoanaerobaculia bacterium]